MRNIISSVLLFTILIITPGLEGFVDTKIHKGQVKFYNEEKGFGYINDRFTKDEIFVYEEFIIDEITDNDIVVYQLRNTRKGYEAINVKLLKKNERFNRTILF